MVQIMTTESNKDIVREFVTTGFFEGNTDAVDEYVSDEFMRHGPDVDEIHGADEYKQFVEQMNTAFPETDGTIDSMVAEDNEVMYRWRANATHEGEFMGVEPTGTSVAMIGMDEVRLEDERIAEIWGVFDVYGLLEQIEALSGNR
jgi:steroid delta-isomerase-like uncharacterized protein